MAKALTFEQAAGRKDKAERFVRDVIRDDERADEIAEESVESYADRRRIIIQNPQRSKKMATKQNTDVWERLRELEKQKAELTELNAELTEQNEELQTKLDNIVNIAAPDEVDDEQDDEEESGEENDGDEDEDEDGDEDEEDDAA